MPMSDTEFHQAVDVLFQTIENAIEKAIDTLDADVDIDASGGVLQLEFEDRSKIVINKQEPLHQIWVATRFGGYHFSYVDNQWIDTRSDAGEFLPFVQTSIEKQSGIKIALV